MVSIDQSVKDQNRECRLKEGRENVLNHWKILYGSDAHNADFSEHRNVAL